MTMPIQKPGKSFQSYGTPLDLLEAVHRRFGPIDFDLAASKDNAVCVNYFTEEDDALSKDWHVIPGLLFCNPPFAHIEPWVKKAAMAVNLNPRARILMLLPASVGSNWFSFYVEGSAHTLFLNPRLTFANCSAPYPKDCLMAYFHANLIGTQVWNWK